MLGNAFACTRNAGLFCGVRQFDISDKTVIYNDSLFSTFACSVIAVQNCLLFCIYGKNISRSATDLPRRRGAFTA